MAWVDKILTWVKKNRVGGVCGVVHKILAWIKKTPKNVGGVGRNFGMGGKGLSCFVKKLLLKVSQNLQESTCTGVSC